MRAELRAKIATREPFLDFAFSRVTPDRARQQYQVSGEPMFNGACNRHHALEQQLCRWLLLTLDRMPTNELVITQELVANALGVRREGVTEAAGNLQRAGIISYRRGHISVLKRSRLEAGSCECYAVVKKEIDRLLFDVWLKPPKSVMAQ